MKDQHFYSPLRTLEEIFRIYEQNSESMAIYGEIVKELRTIKLR